MAKKKSEDVKDGAEGDFVPFRRLNHPKRIVQELKGRAKGKTKKGKRAVKKVVLK